MWILQSDKVTGTYNESDRTCVSTKDQRESKDRYYTVWIYAGKATTGAIFTV